MSKIPRPATKAAYLVSAGYGQPTATQHVYVDTRECLVARALIDGRVVIDDPAWEHVFKCTETDEERRWGVEPRFPEAN